MITFRQKRYSQNILRTNSPFFDNTRNYDQDFGRLGKHLGDLNKELRGGLSKELRETKKNLQKEKNLGRKDSLQRELKHFQINLKDKKKWQSLD